MCILFLLLSSVINILVANLTATIGNAILTGVAVGLFVNGVFAFTYDNYNTNKMYISGIGLGVVMSAINLIYAVFVLF